MSAALKHIDPSGRGHELMLVWALYRRGGEREGLPKAVNGGWSEPLDKEHVNEPASVLAIDRMLAALYRSGYEHSVDIAKRYYLSAQSIWEVASKTRRTVPFVCLTLRGLCGLVEERVTE